MLENLIAAALLLAVPVAAAALLAWDAPVWITVVLVAIGVGVGYLVGRSRRVATALMAYQADLIGEAALVLNEIVSGELDVDFETFVERGCWRQRSTG